MKTAIEIGYLGIPIVVSIAAFVFARRVLKHPLVAQSALPLAGSTAFLVGYWLLPDGVMIPKSHWHWLPYLGVLAAVVGPLGLSTHKVTVVIGWLAYFGVAFLAAWLLVPTWPRLQGVRMLYVPTLAMYLVIVATLLQPLARRVASRIFLALLALSAVSVAAAIAAFVSLVYGYVAGVAAGSLLGCWLARLFTERDSPTAPLVPLYVVLVGGIAFVGYVEPSPPLSGLLLVPAAPLALWICQMSPLARLKGIQAAVAQTLVVLAGLIFAVSMIATA